MTQKFVLIDADKNVLDSVEFEFDPVNYSSAIQQAGDFLVPMEERDAYERGELDAYKLSDGRMRYIEEEMMQQKYFALYDDYAVWGIGSSFREAVDDFRHESKYEAEEWAERLGCDIDSITIDDLRSGDGVFGEMRVIRLTAEAYNDLLLHGWASEKRLKELNGEFGTDAVWRE